MKEFTAVNVLWGCNCKIEQSYTTVREQKNHTYVCGAICINIYIQESYMQDNIMLGYSKRPTKLTSISGQSTFFQAG